MSFSLCALLLLFCWIIAGPAPTSIAYREAQREARTRKQDAAATARRERKAWRLQVFGSHPLLYSALAWLSLPLLLALCALLR